MTEILQSHSSGKLIQLEAARGIASILVIFHHFSLAFAPWIRESFLEGGVRFTPVFTLLNGDGAVDFFYMLSGFVLTNGFYQRPSALGLTRAIVKRLPRLIVPASVTIFAGLLILVSVPAFYKEAAALTKSPWLDGFGSTHFPGDLVPSLGSALRQCLLVFVLSHDSYYNSNLWTMHNEFYGSILVFALSAASITRISRGMRRMLLLHTALAIAFCVIHKPFVPFVLGSGLAYYITKRNMRLALHPYMSASLILYAVIGFSLNIWLGNVTASFSIMFVLLGNSRVARGLSGGLGATLGTLSFPIYLVHTLVIVSLSSWIFTVLVGLSYSYTTTLLFTLLVTLAGTALACIPLAIVESTWVPLLNRIVRQLISSKTDATSAETAGTR